MATRPNLTTPVTTRLASDTQKGLFFAIKAEFDTSTIRVWSGKETLSIGGEDYIGGGDLINVAPVKESNDVRSEGLTITISGMNDTIMTYAVAENYHFRPLTFFMGYLMGDSLEVAGTITLFKGRMIVLTVNDNPNSPTITIQCENRLADLSRPSNLRYTKESQEYLASGDIFFNNINTIQDREITWGRTADSGCFVAGSKVLMGDDTTRNIEDIQVGSSVMAFNEKTGKKEQALVQQVAKPKLEKTIMIQWKKPFFQKGTVQCSTDHPIMCEDKGWCAWDPEATLKSYKLAVKKLEVGDVLVTTEGTIKVSAIKEQDHKEPLQAYNLISIDNAHTYYVNSVLVHNKGSGGTDDENSGRYRDMR